MNDIENKIKGVQREVSNLIFQTGSLDLLLFMNGFHAFPNKENAFIEETIY